MSSAREKFIHVLDDLIQRARRTERERTEVIGLLVDAYVEVGREDQLIGFRQGAEAAVRLNCGAAGKDYADLMVENALRALLPDPKETP